MLVIDGLLEELKKFYEKNKNEDYAFDVVVFNDKDEDISKSQFINEIIKEILK